MIDGASETLRDHGTSHSDVAWGDTQKLLIAEKKNFSYLLATAALLRTLLIVSDVKLNCGSESAPISNEEPAWRYETTLAGACQVPLTALDRG